MSKTHLFILVFCLSLLKGAAQPVWSSEWLKPTEQGRMVYKADKQGNTIPDFSRVGYGSGEKPIPDVSVVETLFPVPGDNREHIQQAIERVSVRAPDRNGFRGAILMKKGVYPVDGTLQINSSGIIIRGEGADLKGTVIRETAVRQVDLFRIGGKGKKNPLESSKVAIAEDFVPVGQMYVKVTDGSVFQKGDSVLLVRPGTDNWIHDLKMDQIAEREGTKQWKAKDYFLYFERLVTDIKEDTVYLDQPVVMQMETKYGGGYLMKYTFQGRIRDCGIENLYMESLFQSETDEKHGWNAISFSSVAHSWVRRVVSQYFGQGCVSIDSNSRNITVQDAQCLDAKSQITGGRRYSFNCNGQLNLFKNCFSTEGRHDFVTGSRTLGPNVFTQCTSRKAHADIGPHHRWACGTLYDRIDTDGEINVQDRGNMGSGHGWAGVTQVIWNCRSPKTAVQSPWVSGDNYCIGLTGGRHPGHFSGRPDGVWEGLNREGLFPESLFEAQLADRLGHGRAKAGKNAGIPLAMKGKLLFEDHFKIPGVYTKEFQTVKGDWKVKAGHAGWEQTGKGIKSIWETGHMPVLVYSGSFTDAIIEVDFRFHPEEGKWAACRISATNPELNPRAYAVSTWANSDNKGRPLGMVLEHDEWKPGVITTVDTLMAGFKPGEWYTLSLEIIGNQARATCNGVSVSGTNEWFGIPKNSVYLGVGTCTHELRNFRVYEARKNPKWE